MASYSAQLAQIQREYEENCEEHAAQCGIARVMEVWAADTYEAEMRNGENTFMDQYREKLDVAKRQLTRLCFSGWRRCRHSFHFDLAFARWSTVE